MDRVITKHPFDSSGVLVFSAPPGQAPPPSPCVSKARRGGSPRSSGHKATSSDEDAVPPPFPFPTERDRERDGG